MEVGKIVLASVVVEHGKTDEFKERMNTVESVSEISDIETKIFGITNEEVTAILLEEWNFDSEMYNAIRYLHNPENAGSSVQKYAQVLHVAKTLISTHNFGKEPQVEAALELVEKYALNKSRFEEVVEAQFNIASV